MGSVWLAHHVGLDTPCAVKFINAEVAAQQDVRARFEREARSAAALRSSHVVQILDYGIWEGFPYIAMEYLEGEDLGERLKRVGRLSPLETALVVAQVARALTKAHAAGLIHRDLKPENIFLVPEDDHEVAKVLDFGIAKTHAGMLDAKNTTKAGALLGTPHYMSPEQAQGNRSIDARSDLWSVAVLTYQCITGSLPFNSEALGDLLLHIMVNPLPVPSEVAPNVPPGFDAWWEKAAARDPADRFQSAKEMADALVGALGVTGALQAGVGGLNPGSGVFNLSSIVSRSLTPARPDASKAKRNAEADTLMANVAPTTGPAVSVDRPKNGERAKGRKVSVGVGVGVGLAALLVGVGLALLGNTYLGGARGSSSNGTTEASQASGVAVVSATAPVAAPTGSVAAGAADEQGSGGAGGAAAASSAAPNGATSIAAPGPTGSGLRPYTKPRKPKERDFGF